VSVSFRQPDPDGTPGEIVDYAWPFDQGPVIGKPGSPIKDPVTGICAFAPITPEIQAQMLEKSGKVLGQVITPDGAMPNLPAHEYVELVKWLDRRDFLVMHNSVHDMHVFDLGLRKGAGGDPGVPERGAAWNPDTMPGQWEPGVEVCGSMMEPSPYPTRLRRRRIWCTMVTQKQLIDPLELAALKKTARRLWGEDETREEAELKAELARQGTGLTKRYDLLPYCGTIGKYAAKDTNLTLRLYEYQLGCAEEGAVPPKFWELHQTEMEFRTALYRMEQRGVYYNVEKSFAEGERMRDLCADLAASMPFDPSKIIQAKKFFFGPVEEGGLGLEPTNRTDRTRQPQLDLPEVHRLVSLEIPWAKEYLRWTKMRNSDSKYYTGWAARTGKDGRIRTSFKQCKNDRERPGQPEGGTKSGRLAVGRWQCQAIPHGGLLPEGAFPVRKLIGVRPGWVQAEHDLATGEARVITVIANSTKMWDLLDQGLDLHGHNTTLLFGVGPDDPNFKHLRNGVKRGTFGIIYLGGLEVVKEQVEAAAGREMPMAAIAKMKADLFREYPEFRKMGEQAEAKVNRYRGGPGYLAMLDGWRRWYALDEKTSSAVNQVIQGNLARAMIYWMLEVERREPGCMLLQIHDSLVTEHPDTEEGRAQAQRVSDIGNEVFEKYFNVRGRKMHFGIKPEWWSEKF
jgi:DNA polymerase I-like protein with 3'-5' exonuclease and polymerase domains